MFNKKGNMRIRIALALLILVSFAPASALPTTQINNSEQVQATVETVGQPAPAEEPKTPTEAVVTPPAQPVQVQTEAPAQPISCGDNQYANFIYMKESSCNTKAVNSIGCRGIGQACPGSKLPCGDDYNCQNAWFTNYALTRYGSWYQAYVFWVNHHWW